MSRPLVRIGTLALAGLLGAALVAACGPPAPAPARSTPRADPPAPPSSPFLRAYPDFRLVPRCLRYVRAYSCYLRTLPLPEKLRAARAYRKLLKAWAAGLAHARKEPQMWGAIRQVCVDALAGFDKAVGRIATGKRCLTTAPAPALLPQDLPQPPRSFVERFVLENPEFQKTPECVAYFRIYACFVSKLPPAARRPAHVALVRTMGAWKRGILASRQSEDAIRAIRKGCRTATDAFARALANNPAAQACLPAPAP